MSRSRVARDYRFIRDAFQGDRLFVKDVETDAMNIYRVLSTIQDDTSREVHLLLRAEEGPEAGNGSEPFTATFAWNEVVLLEEEGPYL